MLHPSEQTGEEYRDNCQRTDVTDEEPEDTEDLYICAECSPVGKFVIYIGLLEAPSHKKDGQETAEGHQDVRRQVVEEVENVASVYLDVGERSE